MHVPAGADSASLSVVSGSVSPTCPGSMQALSWWIRTAGSHQLASPPLLSQPPLSTHPCCPCPCVCSRRGTGGLSGHGAAGCVRGMVLQGEERKPCACGTGYGTQEIWVCCLALPQLTLVPLGMSPAASGLTLLLVPVLPVQVVIALRPGSSPCPAPSRPCLGCHY